MVCTSVRVRVYVVLRTRSALRVGKHVQLHSLLKLCRDGAKGECV